jgi:hypothetical protein
MMTTRDKDGVEQRNSGGGAFEISGGTAVEEATAIKANVSLYSLYFPARREWRRWGGGVINRSIDHHLS